MGEVCSAVSKYGMSMYGSGKLIGAIWCEYVYICAKRDRPLPSPILWAKALYEPMPVYGEDDHDILLDALSSAGSTRLKSITICRADGHPGLFTLSDIIMEVLMFI